ncbi:MAG: sigma-E factor regulatory protein RseB domain-containing protein [Armatimonadota bacterium]
MIHRKLLAFLIPMLFAPALVFAANVNELLQKTETAEKHVSYRGTKVATFHFAGGLMSAKFKVVHLLPDQTRTEFFTPTALSGIIVIQDGPKFWKYYPRHNIWEESSSHLAIPADTIHEETLRNFDLRLIGTDTVAGRPTYIVFAMPHNRLDSARRVWIDKDCYLIMRSQIESPHGSVVNSSRFTSIQINPSDISSSAFKVTGKVRQARKTVDRRFNVIKPTYLPKGYKLIGISRMSVNGYCSAHLQFSNGASVISMFQRKAGKDAAISPVKSKVTNVLTWAHNGIRFMLMGDVPTSELRKIATSTK